MSDFREAQNTAHPNKTNILMSAIIVTLILILTLQIWMMYGALNNALDDNHGFAIATFIGSLFLFIAGLFLLKYLPEPRRKREQNPNNKYE
ncbi:hypothetical protein O2K51_01010 [Apibacter raozihei]|uniref:DUF6755 family protein n=1 Tax=Apibacter TaxID=1778601 RepID=UPI000FE31FBE|nr:MULTISPECIES: DUF6755 family protein [Apibacter]